MKKILVVIVLLAVTTMTCYAETEVFHTVGCVNVRTKPNSISTILTVLPEGKAVVVEGQLGSWAKVKLEEDTGYVCAKYLERVNYLDRSKTITLEVAEDFSYEGRTYKEGENVEAEYLSVIDGEIFARIAIEDSILYIPASHFTISKMISKEMVVKAEAVNLRSSFSKQSRILGNLYRGEVIRIQYFLPGREGGIWVYSDELDAYVSIVNLD